MTEVADSLTWLKGRHTFKMGLDWRWERLERHPAAVADRIVHLQRHRQRSARHREHRHAAGELPARTGPDLLDRSAAVARSRSRAHFQEYFIQDDWKVSDRLTLNPGLRYTLNFPSTEINGQTAVFNLQTQQLEYPGANPVRPLKKNNFGPRLGGVYRLTDKTILSAGYGLIWIEMAGITTPFTTPTFPFLQTVVAARARHHQPGVRARRTGRASRRSRRRRPPAWDRASSPSTARSAPATCSSGTSRCSAS